MTGLNLLLIAQCATTLVLIGEESQFLRDVTHIITDQERATFRGLSTEARKSQFIEQFWLRRDPTPGTAENEFKDEHYRRIAYANEHFGAGAIEGSKTDRGRVYIVYGPPDVTLPFSDGEAWMFHDQGGVSMQVEFIVTAGDYREANRTYSILGVSPDGAALVTIPIEFDAPEYFIKMDLNGHTWHAAVRPCNSAVFTRSKLRSSEGRQAAAPSDAGCLTDTVYRTNLGNVPQMKGRYTFTAVVSDAAGAQTKTYTFTAEPERRVQ
jgi:GWxTD domain-containing protein